MKAKMRYLVRAVSVAALLATAIILPPSAQADQASGSPADKADSVRPTPPTSLSEVHTPPGRSEVWLSPPGGDASPPGRDASGSVSSAATGEGCWTRIYNAWYQGGGVVANFGYTDCYWTEPSIYTRVSLYRSRWYGWEKMDEQAKSRAWVDYVSAEASWYCGGTSHQWLGRSYHQVAWRNGTTTSASLRSDSAPRIDCP